jgi:hypothetical protein
MRSIAGRRENFYVSFFEKKESERRVKKKAKEKWGRNEQ